MRPYIVAQAATGRSGVAAIGVAQEYASVFTGTQRDAPNGIPWFSFHKADRRVTCYYFYLWDEEFGPAFVKICAYFPYPAKIWVNGHEWAKRQATRAGIGFTELSNGFAATDDPAGLQAICDRLGPEEITEFAQRWFSILPLPLTDADAAAGYWWEISMRQVEVSRTIVFTQPRHARGFFEALVADNLDIGRPDQIELIFAGRRVRPGRTPVTPEVFKTKVVTRGVEVTVNAFYQHSRIKQYLKDGRALRVETVINDTYDLGVPAPPAQPRPNSRPGPVRSTVACSILNGSARAVSSRVQPLSGSRTRPPRWTGGGPQPCGSATLGSKPWPAPCRSACSPSPASPTRACAP